MRLPRLDPRWAVGGGAVAIASILLLWPREGSPAASFDDGTPKPFPTPPDGAQASQELPVNADPVIAAFINGAPRPGAARETYFERSAVEPEWIDVDLGDGIVITVSADVVKSASGVRLPLWPSTAQRIADRFDSMLPTTNLSDAIWRAATIKLAPYSITPPRGVSRDAASILLKHETRINEQIAGRRGLVAGHKKDLVIGATAAAHPDKMTIYGWHRLNGQPIQGLSDAGVPSYVHSKTYGQDYSTGARLIKRMARRYGQGVPLATLFADASVARILSLGGTLTPAQLRYPNV